MIKYSLETEVTLKDALKFILTQCSISEVISELEDIVITNALDGNSSKRPENYTPPNYKRNAAGADALNNMLNNILGKYGYISKVEPPLDEEVLMKEFMDDEVDDGKPVACTKCLLNSCSDTCPHIFQLLKYYNIKSEKWGSVNEL